MPEGQTQQRARIRRREGGCPGSSTKLLGNKDAQIRGPAVQASGAAAERRLLPTARLFIRLKNTHHFANSLLTSSRPLLALSAPTPARGDASRGQAGAMPAGVEGDSRAPRYLLVPWHGKKKALAVTFRCDTPEGTDKGMHPVTPSPAPPLGLSRSKGFEHKILKKKQPLKLSVACVFRKIV